MLVLGRDESWECLCDAQKRQQWWPDTLIDFSPGGSIRTSLAAETLLTGQVDVVLTGHALGFSWRRAEDPWATTALITLTTLSGSTQVSVVELGFMGFQDETRRMREAFTAWDERLSALEALVRASPAPSGHDMQKA